MSEFFPRSTTDKRPLEDSDAFRRFRHSLPATAITTGIVLRLFRAVVLDLSGAPTWWYLGGTLTIGIVFLLGMTTLHLGHYTLRHWPWRAPVFAVVVAAAEMVTSAALTAAQLEPHGTVRATMRDWPSEAVFTLLTRLAVVTAYALVLAGVVQLVRYVLVKREGRMHTAERIARTAERPVQR